LIRWRKHSEQRHGAHTPGRSASTDKGRTSQPVSKKKYVKGVHYKDQSI
jgi:hypothetical protein